MQSKNQKHVKIVTSKLHKVINLYKKMELQDIDKRVISGKPKIFTFALGIVKKRFSESEDELHEAEIPEREPRGSTKEKLREEQRDYIVSEEDVKLRMEDSKGQCKEDFTLVFKNGKDIWQVLVQLRYRNITIRELKVQEQEFEQ